MVTVLGEGALLGWTLMLHVSFQSPFGAQGAV